MLPPTTSQAQQSPGSTWRLAGGWMQHCSATMFLDTHTECHTFCSDIAADECSTRSLLPPWGVFYLRPYGPGMPKFVMFNLDQFAFSVLQPWFGHRVRHHWSNLRGSTLELFAWINYWNNMRGSTAGASCMEQGLE